MEIYLKCCTGATCFRHWGGLCPCPAGHESGAHHLAHSAWRISRLAQLGHHKHVALVCLVSVRNPHKPIVVCQLRGVSSELELLQTVTTVLPSAHINTSIPHFRTKGAVQLSVINCKITVSAEEISFLSTILYTSKLPSWAVGARGLFDSQPVRMKYFPCSLLNPLDASAFPFNLQVLMENSTAHHYGFYNASGGSGAWMWRSTSIYVDLTASLACPWTGESDRLGISVNFTFSFEMTTLL